MEGGKKERRREEMKGGRKEGRGEYFRFHSCDLNEIYSSAYLPLKHFHAVPSTWRSPWHSSEMPPYEDEESSGHVKP